MTAHRRFCVLLLSGALSVACETGASARKSAPKPQGSAEQAARAANATQLRVATFAGGCFWCAEADFEKVDGVVKAVSGFSGGNTPNPTYGQVARGATKHLEAVQVHYDPKRVNYQRLLDAFWRMIDPTDAGGSFVDRGKQYRSAIFAHNARQKSLALASKARLEKLAVFDAPIVTQVRELEAFYPVGGKHQDFYKTHPGRYRSYRSGSGRDAFVKKAWADVPPLYTTYSAPETAALKKSLSKRAYNVTQKDGTEPPFKNPYYDHKAPGIYVDVVSGEPLFSSTHKFASGTGWPSFTQPLEPFHVLEKQDRTHGMVRTEVRSRFADSHLGHVFEDGPEPTGRRHCINSAALRFIPAAELEEQGYGQYAYLFAK